MNGSDDIGPRSPRRRRRRTSIRVYLGTTDRQRLDRWARARGIGPATLIRALVVDGLDRAGEPDTVPPDWRPLLTAPTGTHDRRRYAPHLKLSTLLRIVGTVKTAALLNKYGGSRLPSARTHGLRLRRDALLASWEHERWAHPRYLARLAQTFGMSAANVRRVIGHRYWTARKASYWRRRGVEAERAEQAGVIRKPTARPSIRVLT